MRGHASVTPFDFGYVACEGFFRQANFNTIGKTWHMLPGSAAFYFCASRRTPTGAALEVAEMETIAAPRNDQIPEKRAIARS
jgi:hypothetical protein